MPYFRYTNSADQTRQIRVCTDFLRKENLINWLFNKWDAVNSAYPDQMPKNMASDQGLHCLYKKIKSSYKLFNTCDFICSM